MRNADFGVRNEKHATFAPVRIPSSDQDETNVYFCRSLLQMKDGRVLVPRIRSPHSAIRTFP
jgi:hypothetical protein